MQVVATFTVHRIKCADTKFMHVISVLSLEEVDNVLSGLPPNRKYKAIKEALIQRISDSDAVRVRKLLENDELGDRTSNKILATFKKII